MKPDGPEKPVTVSLYLRLTPQMIKRLDNIEKNTGVNRADIIQQALEYALARLEVKK